MNSLSHPEAHERIVDLALEPRALAALADALDAADGGGGVGLDDGLSELLEHVRHCRVCTSDVAAWVATYAALDAATAGDREDAPTTLRALTAEPALAAPANLRAAIAASIHPSGGSADAAADAGVDPDRDAVIAPIARDVDQGPPSRLGAFRGARLRPSVWSVSQRLLPLAAVLAVVVGSVAVVRDQSSKLEASRQETAALKDVASVLGRLVVDPTHHVEALTAADGSARGTLAWSKHDLVVMTAALSAPAAGSEYRCWVERGGKRTKVGTMWFAGDLAYWNGSLDEWATVSLDGGGTFGVSLETVGGTGAGGSPVLQATLPG